MSRGGSLSRQLAEAAQADLGKRPRKLPAIFARQEVQQKNRPLTQRQMEKRKRVQRGDISPDEDSFEPASSGEDQVREREDDPEKVDGQAPQTPSGGVEKSWTT